MVRIIYFIFFIILLTTACKDTKESYLRYPSDYLFAQRSFPYGKVDMSAYRASLEWQSETYLKAAKSKEEAWMSLGPYNLAGRVSDLEIHPEDEDVIYVGSASGGIYYSENGGREWTSIFDDSESLSIGDLALYKNNPDIIYAGTGESNAGGGSIAYDGNGIYKSSDGGQTWTHKGLELAGSIGKIVIDPDDSERVFVAAMGALFSNNQERGVYRSLDGGDNWEQILFLSDSTGAIDLAIHPENADIIYAAMWERIRRPHNRQYGGASSGVYRSEDGGDSWQELTNGLPTLPAEKGRIGLAISELQPNILYAYYARSNGHLQGIYRSDDGGETWIRKSTRNINDVSFMWWFGKIYVHPNDPDRVFVTSLNMFVSSDGGNNWELIFPGAHVDQQAMAFSPTDDDRMYNGNDGGVYFSADGGKSIQNYLNGMDNFQFYTCTIDPNDPNTIYGGAQDNGTVVYKGDEWDWSPIFGGDGFRILVDPTDSDQIYFEAQNGAIFSSSEGGGNPRFAAISVQGQFNWNTPLAMDKFNSNVLYTGTQRLYRSVDKAQNWEAISPELVNPEGPRGNISYGTLTYIETSGHDEDVIYIGTDDGNVWRSLDGGDSYDDISTGIPERWITSIAYDPWSPSGVYLTVSGFRFGDSKAQVFYSDDYGDTWSSLASELPDIPVNDIVIDDQLQGYIYLATDIGVYVSEDGGTSWSALGTDLPKLPFIDLDYHSASRKIVAASYGRGMFSYNLPDLSSNRNFSNLSYKIYPNPVIGKLFIESSSLIKSVTVYNVNGQKLLSQSQTKSIDFSGFTEGIYYVHIYTDEGVVIEKIVKQG